MTPEERAFLIVGHLCRCGAATDWNGKHEYCIVGRVADTIRAAARAAMDEQRGLANNLVTACRELMGYVTSDYEGINGIPGEIGKMVARARAAMEALEATHDNA